MALPTLALTGLTTAEIALFETVIELAGGIELSHWRIIEDMTAADVVVANIDSRGIKDELGNLESDNATIVALSSKNVDEEYALSLLRPVTYVSLVRLMKQAQTELADKKNRRPAIKKPEPVQTNEPPKQIETSKVAEQIDIVPEPPATTDLVENEAVESITPNLTSEAQTESADQQAAAVDSNPDTTLTSLDVLQDSSISLQPLDSRESDPESIESTHESESGLPKESDPITAQPESPDNSLPELSISALDLPADDELHATADSTEDEPAAKTESPQLPELEELQEAVESNDPEPEDTRHEADTQDSENLLNLDPSAEEEEEPVDQSAQTPAEIPPTESGEFATTDPINPREDSEADSDPIQTIEFEPESDNEIEVTTDQLIISTEFSIDALDAITEPHDGGQTAELNDLKIAETLKQETARQQNVPVQMDEDKEKNIAGDEPVEPGKVPPSSTGAWLDDMLTPLSSNPVEVQPEALPVALDEIIRPAKRFYPEMRFLGTLKSIIKSAENCHIRHKHYPQLTVYPQTDWFSFPANLEDVREIFQIPGNEFLVDEFGWHKKPRPSNDGTAKELWTLVYAATLYGSEGRLLQNADAHVAIRLREPPDFSKIPHTDEHLRMATYLRDYAANLSQIATVTQTSIRTVIDFTNACREIDLVEEVSSTTSAQPQPAVTTSDSVKHAQVQRPGLLSRIHSSLLRHNLWHSNDK